MARISPRSRQVININPSVQVIGEFRPTQSNPVENIRGMRAQLVQNIHDRWAVPAARQMRSFAMANARWEDQPESIHNPEKGYPYGHAREQIVAQTTVSGGNIVVVLGHSRKTVQVRKGNPIYYGNILEFGHGGDEDAGEPGKYGILLETMEHFQPVLMKLLEGAALEGVTFRGTSARKPPGA